MPAESFRAVVLISDRTPPTTVQDRFAPRAGAQTIRAHLFCGRGGRGNQPAKTNREEKRLLGQVIHPHLLLPGDSEGRNRLAKARVQSLRLCCERARLLRAKTQSAASSASSRPKRPFHKIG